MNLHEYQAKLLFKEYGIPVSPGLPANSVEEAVKNAVTLGGNGWVVKAQVHAGGRGKAGGVKLAHTMDQVKEYSQGMLGKRLVTTQSGPEGNPVNCVLIQTMSDIESELYLGMLVDRGKRRIVVMGSRAGGMDIEEVAQHEPEKIFTFFVDPIMGLQDFQSRRMGFELMLNDKQIKQLTVTLRGLYKLFIEKDLSLVEINPLIITKTGDIEALDGKVTVDDSAMYRQAGLEKWRDEAQENEMENIAKRFDLNYVALDGNIACMVNGAGLAMATMDIIKLHGGEPANFLDVGGGASQEKVTAAFRLITSDPRVEGIFVNIFGGIMKCDVIANGIIAASKEIGLTVPVVVRLEGTNVDLGKKILSESGLGVIPADDMADGARKIIAAINRA